MKVGIVSSQKDAAHLQNSVVLAFLQGSLVGFLLYFLYCIVLYSGKNI